MAKETLKTADKSPSPGDLPQDGLYLAGIVKGRTRREYDRKGGGKRYNITLRVLTPDGLFNVERWSDVPSPTDIPLSGQRIVLKINLTFYRTATGEGVRLTWGPGNAGEEF